MSEHRIKQIHEQLLACGVSQDDASFAAVKKLLGDYDADLQRHRARLSILETENTELRNVVKTKNDELREIAVVAHIQAPVSIRSMNDLVPKSRFENVVGMVKHMKEVYERRIFNLERTTHAAPVDRQS